MVIQRKFIGSNGAFPTLLNLLGVWTLGISKSSIMPCLLNRFDVLFITKTLCFYRVFSAKYFPNGSILEDPIHLKCFYAWRSILQAREVIHKGAIWRVGNGEKIDVWNHHWLPEPTSSMIVSPKSGSLVSQVCDLFYSNSRI